MTGSSGTAGVTGGASAGERWFARVLPTRTS
jgi:hypothetical protein